MSGMSQGARTGPRDRIVFAAVLILVGVAGLALQVAESTPGAGGVVVLLIGLGLLGAFAFTRQYGYLIPGGIMTGLGAGIVASEALTLTDEGTGGVIVLGLGLGFLSIWVIGGLVRVVEHHWWPLIPGGILAVIGAALLVGGQAVGLLDYWYVVVIALGVIVLGWGLVGRRPGA
jgi:hypothetical protein